MDKQSVQRKYVKRTKVLQQQYRLSREQARILARALPEGDIAANWLEDIDAALICWDCGRDLRDIRLAARHAASIILVQCIAIRGRRSRTHT